QKNWPYMKHGQKIRLYSWDEENPLFDKERMVCNIAAKWIRRLIFLVNYDLKRKLVEIDEVSKDDEDAQAPNKWGEMYRCLDENGGDIPKTLLESWNKRVECGDYFLIHIKLYTSNWPPNAKGMLEDGIV